MKILYELEFIDTKPGSLGQYHYVLIWNPYIVIERHRESGKIQQLETYNTFLERAIAIGALD